jgi:putative membrane protein
MKSLSRILAAAVIVVAAACSHSHVPPDVASNANTVNNNDATSMASASTAPAGKEVSSPDITAIMFAANQGEVDQANAALPKLSSSDVRDFAQMMIRDHSDALTNLRNITSVNHIIQHEGAFDAIQLRNESKQLVTNYNTSAGSIDRSYMADQVRVHEKVLNMLDTMLIPSSRGDLLNLLQAQRAAVAAHLDRARTILTNLP